jgi:dihydroorotase
MLEAGFLPDVISSDVHAVSINGPAFDLLHTMSKFLVMGVPLPAVVQAATSAPAAAIGRKDLGTFKPGSIGDATLLHIEEGEFTYHDVLGVPLHGNKRLASRGIVLGGKWWHPG